MMVDYVVMGSRPQEPLDAQPFHTYESPEGRTWTEFHRSGTSYLLRFPGYADFEVSACGTRVAGYPAAGVDPATLEHLYINQVLPLALSRQGRLSFHASAVTVGEGAIAFLGRSGRGKSTLAAQFAATGERFLTDDGLILVECSSGLQVQPNRPSIRLWHDSRQALLHEGLTVAPPVSYTSKARVLAGEGLPFCEEPRRLIAAYVLDGDETPDTAIQKAEGVQAVIGWIGNSFLLDVEDRTLLTHHFENAIRVTTAVPTFHLHYPRRYEALPDVQAAIAKHAGTVFERSAITAL
jgi:hypothetical protein